MPLFLVRGPRAGGAVSCSGNIGGKRKCPSARKSLRFFQTPNLRLLRAELTKRDKIVQNISTFEFQIHYIGCLLICKTNKFDNIDLNF